MKWIKENKIATLIILVLERKFFMTNWKYILIIVILAVIVGGGIFSWQYFGAPKEEVKTLEEETEGEMEDEIADWKVYRNDEYRFEFKYSSEFSLKEGRDVSEFNYQSGIIFSGPELRSDRVSIFFLAYDNPQQLNLDDYIAKKYGEDFLMGNEYTSWINEKRGTIDIWWHELRPNMGGFESQAFLKNIQNLNMIIVVNFNTDGEKELAENDYIIFNQIISTFRFLE